MGSRRILIFLVLLVILLIIARPKMLWAEFKRIRTQWNTILGLLVTVIFVYLVYGLYTAWSNGAFDG